MAIKVQKEKDLEKIQKDKDFEKIIKEKDDKEIIKDHKELKDKDHKEVKDKEKEKDKEKDKDKEKEKEKEFKEFKEHKEFKEFKEKDKEFKEFKEKDKDLVEGGGLPGQGGDPGPLVNQLMQRIVNLENQMATAKAFIREEERPDVGGTALRGKASAKKKKGPQKPQ